MTNFQRPRTPGALVRLITVLIGFTLAACGSGGGEADSEIGAAPGSKIGAGAARDTTNASAFDGLSRKQVERRAEPITPREAEHRGLRTMNPDSAPPSPP